MKYFSTPKYIVSLLLFCLPLVLINGQQNQFSVEPAPFSSIGKNDFAPMWYKDGIVYCSNFKERSFLAILKKKTYTLFYTNLADSTKSKTNELFSFELTSRMNDGPITFNNDLSTAYFNRNHKISSIFKSFPDSINPLGIFSAKYIDNRWRHIEPFPYNNPHYSLLTPMLSPDNKRLYFASDMPGGYGGTDLYYSDWDGKKWLPPVNMCSIINTPGNESYPFITIDGTLFFSSDGHPGLGGKDIFFTYSENDVWARPINLGEGINTPFDDFGLIITDNFSEGYFTSNRTNYDIIYEIEKNIITFDKCEKQKENNYCYIFKDNYIFNEGDTTIKYIWRFEDSILKEGEKVHHCFSKTGNHTIDLIIEDKIIKDSILFNHTIELEIKSIEQPYIDSPIFIKTNEEAHFTANSSSLPNIARKTYIWNFGERFVEDKNEQQYKFSKSGNYKIKLGVSGFNKRNNNFESKCVSKEVIVYDNILDILYSHSSNFTDLRTQLNSEIDLNNEPSKDIYIYLLNSLSQEKKLYIFEQLIPFYLNHKKLNSNNLSDSEILKEAVKIITENNNIELKLLIDKSSNSSHLKNQLTNFITEEINKNEQFLNISISEIEKSNKNYILELLFK